MRFEMYKPQKIYKIQKLNFKKLEKASDKIVYQVLKQAESDLYESIGLSSTLLIYEPDLHNAHENDRKELADIALKIQAELDKRKLPYKKICTKPYQPQPVETTFFYFWKDKDN